MNDTKNDGDVTEDAAGDVTRDVEMKEEQFEAPAETADASSNAATDLDAISESKQQLEETAAEEKAADETGSIPAVKQADSAKSAEAATSPSTRSSLRRDRKPTQTYTVSEFRETPEAPLAISSGRGKALGSFEATKLKLEAASAQDHDNIHQLLFLRKYRAKQSKKDILPNILKFNGYLPHEEGYTEAELAALVEEVETRYSTRAYKLKVGEVKRLCDVLAIDRSGCNDKESLIDALLDFLGNPSEEMLVSAGKGSAGSSSKLKRKSTGSNGSRKSAPPKKKRKRGSKAGHDEIEEDNDVEDKADKEEKGKEHDTDKESLYEQPPKGELPSDAELRKWVRAFVRCYNMDKVTIKTAIEIATDKFGVDMAAKKGAMKIMLTEEL